jgi:hypothetical protein
MMESDIIGSIHLETNNIRNLDINIKNMFTGLTNLKSLLIVNLPSKVICDPMELLFMQCFY